MNTRRKSLIAALALAVPLGLSACGSSASSTEAAAQSSSHASSPPRRPARPTA